MPAERLRTAGSRGRLPRERAPHGRRRPETQRSALAEPNRVGAAGRARAASWCERQLGQIPSLTRGGAAALRARGGAEIVVSHHAQWTVMPWKWTAGDPGWQEKRVPFVGRPVPGTPRAPPRPRSERQASSRREAAPRRRPDAAPACARLPGQRAGSRPARCRRGAAHCAARVPGSEIPGVIQRTRDSPLTCRSVSKSLEAEGLAQRLK
jgi:hypothetical protein